jgi:hypothetical protein
MLRPVAIMAGIGICALLAGCADIMQQGAISQIAPEWFEEKAIEVKGQGYPELADIPEIRQPKVDANQSETTAEALKMQAALMEAKLVADGVIPADEDVRARAAQWRACVEERKSDCGTPDKPAPSAATTPAKAGR